MMNQEKNFADVNRDPRFKKALNLFNSEEWYLAHDAFEELWHETNGPQRITLQGLLQVAVAQVHLESGNSNGATILYGEGLGRLKRESTPNLGLDLNNLCNCIDARLKALQEDEDPNQLNIPFLYKLN